MSTPANPDFAGRLRAIFGEAAFIADLGIELVDCGPGWCETRLPVSPRHMQQNQLVHAGVQATMADHTAGGAAGTLMAPDQIVLTVEFKIQLLRPARGDFLTCRADVIRPGRQITAVEATVLTPDGAAASKLTATMALRSASQALS